MYLPIMSATNDAVAVVRYIAFVIVEGDWANDWLTHITDPNLQASMLVVGQWLSVIMGG